MRDTSDMTEDALSEDRMMDCESDGGGGLEDITSDVADSSPTIRDAAERLLTLLGVDEDDEDLLSSSEDEGVELDVDELDGYDEYEEEEEEEEEEQQQQNNRLLHELAASLVKELKQQSHQKQNSTKILARSSFKDPTDLTGTSYLERGSSQKQNLKGASCYRASVSDKWQKYDSSRSMGKDHGYPEPYQRLDPCSRMDQRTEASSHQVTECWGAGWDACATEALRYLVEDEGLHPHHPTVLAMKNHLELQRERAFFAQYTV